MEYQVTTEILGRLSFEERLEFVTGAAIEAVSQQALQDCNFYCKQDTSALINSSLIHSDTREGILRWVTPYAEYQYELPNTRTVKNPNARPRWCNVAEGNHKAEWDRVFENALRRYSR